MILLSMLMLGFGGCAQAEKTRYVRHLTTTVAQSATIPEEAIITFDIDRKRVEGVLAAGSEN